MTCTTCITCAQEECNSVTRHRHYRPLCHSLQWPQLPGAVFPHRSKIPSWVYTYAQDLAGEIGTQLCKALPGFHAPTGLCFQRLTVKNRQRESHQCIVWQSRAPWQSGTAWRRTKTEYQNSIAEACESSWVHSTVLHNGSEGWK